MIRLREATDDDSAGVIAMIGGVFAEYEGMVLDIDAEEPELRAPATRFDRFWVLESDGTVVGCAACTLYDDRVEMKKIYLDRSMRGQGWGRRLIELVEETAREVGAARIEAWSDIRFTTAHGVYGQLGYARGAETRDLHDLSNTTEFHFTKTV